jgi:hypothetical protein
VYRVLRVSARGVRRSVDRDYAGHNTKPEGSSVKGLSPVKLTGPWWPSYYVDAKAAPKPERDLLSRWPEGTTGVRDHGMYGGLGMEPRRSLKGRPRMVQSPR